MELGEAITPDLLIVTLHSAWRSVPVLLAIGIGEFKRYARGCSADCISSGVLVAFVFCCVTFVLGQE